MYFHDKRYAIVVLDMPTGILHFYFSSGLFKKR